MKIDNNKIENEIHKIYNNLHDINTTDVSLIFGLSGLFLFAFEYEKKFKVKIKLSDKFLDSIVSNVNDLKKTSYSEGLAGVGWVLSEYYNSKNINCNEFLEDFDEIITLNLDQYLKNKDFDFLHGAIGLGNYFLKRKEKKNIEKIIISLRDNCKKDEKGIRWSSFLYKNGDSHEVEELSLSHGLGSILVFLCESKKILKNKIEVTKDINEIVKFILFYMKINKENSFNSIFPDTIRVQNKEQEYNSRLAWCIGDLGIAYSLLKASIVLKDFDLYILSIKIAKDCSLRKKRDLSNVIDAELCHGSSGLYLLFNEFYLITKIRLFKTTSLFWLKRTINLSKNKSFFCGYKIYGGQKEGWVSEYGFLSGVSGIGLAYLDFVNQKSKHNWKQTLLIY